MRTIDQYNLAAALQDEVLRDCPVSYFPCTEATGDTVRDVRRKGDFTLSGTGSRSHESVLASSPNQASIYSPSNYLAAGSLVTTARLNWGMEIWVRLESFALTGNLLTNGLGGTNGYSLRIRTTGVYDIIFGGVVATGSVPAHLYVTTHLFLRRSNGNVVLFVDGVPNFLTTATPSTPTTESGIGFKTNGWYGHAAFYDYGLPANRILSHYNAGKGCASRNRVAVSTGLPWVYYRAGKGAAA